MPFVVGEEPPLPADFLAGGGKPSARWGVQQGPEVVEPPAKRRKVE